MVSSQANTSGAAAFWQSPNFNIERYMDPFHKLVASNEEIRTTEERCMNERFDPIDSDHHRALRKSRLLRIIGD